MGVTKDCPHVWQDGCDCSEKALQDRIAALEAEVVRLRAYLIRKMQAAWDAKRTAEGDEIEGLLQPILPAEYKAALSAGRGK